MNPSIKATPMSKDEAMLLVQLVAASSVINNKATNATSNKMKDEAWQTLAVDFNSSVSSSRRTPAQLRLKWDNLKKAARKRCANMRVSRYKTGGGKDYFPPDEVLDKVASMLGSTCQGLSAEFGGDATIIENFSTITRDVDMEKDDNNSDGFGDICGGGGDGEERVVLKEMEILETPHAPPKQKNFFFNRASGSGTLAKRRQKMEEETSRARIARENVLTEYLIVKKRKVELENEEKEIHLAKLKLDLENTRLENARLRKMLNLD